jgi:uncharacterized protein YoaH (UPF0181 family)
VIRKFATAQVLDVRYSSNKLSSQELTEGFSKLAKPNEISDDGYLYVTTRAISSRVNKNNDGWPSIELARTDDGYGYKTFEGRPIFVDHNNDNPERTRGVVVSSKLHVEDTEKASAFDPYYATAPDNHKPPTWIELMLEVDAKSFPRLASDIISGRIDSVSMGANIDKSRCSVCDHEAENPTEYCSHVKMKGATFEIESSDGTKSHKKAYEDCYGINFFEISFVFDPADETALVSDMSPEREAALRAVAALEAAGAPIPADLQKQAAGSIFDQEDPGDPRNVVGDPEFAERGEEPAVLQQSEPDRVNAWQLQQFMSLGLSGEEAEAAVKMGIDWHDLGNFLQDHPGASAEQALRILTPLDHVGKEAAFRRDLELMKTAGKDDAAAIQLFQNLKKEGVASRDAIKQVAERFYKGDFGAAQAAISRNAKTAKTAVGPPGKDHHNLDHHRQDVERERQLNHEPQADKMTAPEQVDTMRPEIICKNCGSTVEPDSAGQLICQECGTEVEPEGLDNPDLEMAKDIDLRQDKTEERNPEGEMETELEHDKGETEIPSKSPVKPVAPISSTNTDHVKDEMKFSDVHDVTAGDPAMVRGIVAFMQGEGVEVEDEVELARIVTEASNFKGEPSIYDAAEAIEVYASKTAATQDNSDSRTDVKVNTEKKRPSNSPAAQTASEKILSDQLAPVESKFEVLAETELEDEDTTMANDKTADRETIKREETDGSGVKRTEEITKEYGPMADSADEPVAEGEEAPEDAEAEGEEEAPAEGEEAESAPESDPSAEESDDSAGITDHNLPEEEKVPAMASNEEGKLMAALKLAKLASTVGVISADEELEFAGELESSETLAEIEARTNMLERVKEAGLSKKRTPVVAGRVPSFRSASSFDSAVEDADDEDLFM